MTEQDRHGQTTRREIWRGSVGSFGIDAVTLPNGVRLELAVLRHPGAAAVVPFVDAETIVLLRQFRHAAGGMLWEIPAGKLHEGEDPAVCIERELTEETGYTAETFTRLGRIHTAPGFTDEVIELFAATGLTAGAAAPEESEIIEVVSVAFDAALEMVDRGEITDAKTICALHLALRARTAQSRQP